MKIHHVLLAIAGATALTLSGCGDRQDTADSDAPADSSVSAPDDRVGASDVAAPPAGDAGTAGEIMAGGERAALGVLNAINDHQIAAARMALEVNVDEAVSDYANQMIRKHTLNREQTQTLNPDSASAEAQEQARKGKEKRDVLAGALGDEFARAYVAAMVTDHTETLADLDNRLIPSATNPAIRSHLQRTREHVSLHLERARELQSNY